MGWPLAVTAGLMDKSPRALLSALWPLSIGHLLAMLLMLLPFTLLLALTEWQRQIKTILAELSSAGWERLSAGAGSKGARRYEWRRLEVSAPAQAGWKRFLLIRRSISDPSELTGYIVFARADTTLSELVRVAGTRWTVEESIQTAKGEVGLDHYEVRSFTGWYRHMSLAMWAQAFLSVIREALGAEVAPTKGLPNQRAHSSLAAFKASRKLQSG